MLQLNFKVNKIKLIFRAYENSQYHSGGKSEKTDSKQNPRASTKFNSSMNVVRGKESVITKASELGAEEIKDEKIGKQNKRDSIANSTATSNNKAIPRDSIKEHKDITGEEQLAAKRISTQNVIKIKDVLNSKK